MKVCTEACIFGAWAQPGQARRILDIGAGTGLLSLMLAQRTGAIIDAVEINEAACTQAAENFQKSAWSHRLNAIHADIKEYAKNHEGEYDFIISNPPFYENHPGRDEEAENAAMHQSNLSFPDLIACVKKLLSPGGKFALLLPEPQSVSFERQAGKRGINLHVEKQLFIFNTLPGRVFRIVSLYSQTEPDGFELEEIAIRDKQNLYTRRFKELLDPYYDPAFLHKYADKETGTVISAKFEEPVDRRESAGPEI